MTRTTTAIWRDPGILIVPAIAFLVLGFAVPLVLFFVETLREIGSFADIVDEAVTTISSRAVVNAMFTTNWLSLIHI